MALAPASEGPRCAPVLWALGNPRATEQHNGAVHARFLHHHLWLEKLQLQTHGAQFAPHEEIIIGEGQFIGWGPGLGRVGQLAFCLDILVGISERAIGGAFGHGNRPDVNSFARP